MNIKFVSCLLICSLTASLAFSQNKPNDEGRRIVKTKSLGKNIVSFSPVQLMVNDDDGQADATIGLSYERILNNQMIGIKLPVYGSLQKPYVYLMPTIKLYPKKQGTVKYAIGPQFLIAFGRDEETRYVRLNTQSGYWITEEYNRNQFGFLLNHSVNFTVARSFYMALDAGIGIIYADNKKSSTNSSNVYTPFGGLDGVQPVFQLNFNMGYRF